MESNLTLTFLALGGFLTVIGQVIMARRLVLLERNIGFLFSILDEDEDE